MWDHTRTTWMQFVRLLVVGVVLLLMGAFPLRSASLGLCGAGGGGDVPSSQFLAAPDNNAAVAAVVSNTKTEKTIDFGGSPWCPNAIACHRNSDMCRPCRRRFLIVIATGRSASTTLTYMLDSLPGVRMSGENNDELKAIRGMIDNIKEVDDFKNGAQSKGPWGHNAIPEGAFACVAQSMMETINPPLTDGNGTVLENDSETIVGFKTVRFLENVKDDEETEELVRWVQWNFPCARIVINIRSNVKDQAASWSQNFGIANAKTDELNAINARMRNLVKLFGEDQAYLLDSSDWLDDIQHLNQAVEWLGFHKSCSFTKLLEFNTQGYGNGKTEQDPMSPDCRYLGE